MADSTTPTTMSDLQRACLGALAELTRPYGEMCVGFRPVMEQTGLERTAVKRSVRALARKGLAEFHVGLCNDDGAFAGAGYCVTPDGERVARSVS